VIDKPKEGLLPAFDDVCILGMDGDGMVLITTIITACVTELPSEPKEWR
jgi:hypothetical protein